MAMITMGRPSSIPSVTLLLLSTCLLFSFTLACDCKSVGDSFLVTRLWNIIDGEWTDQMVIDEFDNGFAPEVTMLPGFQEYASAKTGDATTVFFMNIFETREDAKAAQEGAKTFVQKGALNGVITPNQFTETELAFWVQNGDECNTDSFVGQYMGTQLWSLTEEAVLEGNWTISSVAAEMELGFLATSDLTSQPGFLEYGGASVTSTDYVFFYHVYDSLEGVQQFHTNAEAFITNHAQLNGVLDKIVFTEGVVGFDYTCAAGNLPAETGESGGTGATATEDNGESAATTTHEVMTATTTALAFLVLMALSVAF